MESPKIKISDFKYESDLKTLSFATTVVEKVTMQSEVYKDVKTLFDEVELAKNAYSTALDTWLAAKSSNNNRAKNDTKAALVSILEDFGAALRATCKGSETYILNAGMPLMEKRTTSQPSVLDAPTVKELYSLRGAGCIFFYLKVPQKSRVKLIAMEWSDDDGKTWNGGYFYGTVRNKVTDLPSLKRLSFRFYSMDSRNNRSGYSEEVTINVT
jgi:hypothetical protein